MLGVAREDMIGAVGVMLRETAGRPVKTLKHMKKFGDEVVKIVSNKSELQPDAKDKRFLDPAFKANPFYKAGMQYYLAVRKGVGDWMEELDFDETERARASFVTGMILDSIAPTNSLIGNPSAIKKAFETSGGSLIQRPEERLRGHHQERQHRQSGGQAPVQGGREHRQLQPAPWCTAPR